MTAPIVKICGVTRPEDGAACVRAGADWVGLNFWPRSPRAVDRGRAVEIADAVRGAGGAELVGVFVNEDPAVVAELSEVVGLDRIQLHGDEPARQIEALGSRGVAALRLSGERDLERALSLRVPVLLLDAPSSGYGGSGELADWELARRAVSAGRRVMVAGGLGPQNVADALRQLRPFGVDVASGVESSPGIKDIERVEAFVEAAKR